MFDGLRFNHWQTERRPDGILILTMDRADNNVNALAQVVLEELDQILERVAIEKPAGLVIRSGKAAGFIPGADLKEFQGFDARGLVKEAIERGQNVFQRLAELPCPTVAAITAIAWAAAPRWRWPAVTAWPPTMTPPASACRK